ncbi:hypothetical protein ACN2WE_04825 [Streptomyces sp. cg28]|uniref:hypothetical protein n=1 Tax=Streptomyces sp. cg28 TaxID=3403457 RepID=UPI003B21FD61
MPTQQLQQPTGWSTIPVLCFIRHPDDVIRCTLHAGHDGDHRHSYTRRDWPQRAGETQAD